MSDGNVVFDVVAFLEEYGGGFEPTYDLMQMEVNSGIGVFAGRESKLFVANTNDKKVVEEIKNQARQYAGGLKGLDYEPTVKGAIEQVWYLPILNRDKQPNWKDGEWRELRKYTGVQVNGKWEPTGDWVVFIRQWADDDAPVKSHHFGKKLWVLAKYVPHPDFNEDMPTKYTAQMKDGAFFVGEDGKYKPQYIRVVHQVLGDRAAADAWLAANGGDSKDSNSEHDEALEKELIEIYNRMPILQRKQYSGVAEWLPNAKEILSILQQGGDTSDWVSSGLVTKNAIDEIDALAKAYPPF